jgi:hypothetical protein
MASITILGPSSLQAVHLMCPISMICFTSKLLNYLKMQFTSFLHTFLDSQGGLPALLTPIPSHPHMFSVWKTCQFPLSAFLTVEFLMPPLQSLPHCGLPVVPAPSSLASPLCSAPISVGPMAALRQLLKTLLCHELCYWKDHRHPLPENKTHLFMLSL